MNMIRCHLVILISVIPLSICQDDFCLTWKVSPTQSTPNSCGTCCLSLNDILEGKINGTTVNVRDDIVTFKNKNSLEFLFQSGDYTVSARNSENDVLEFEDVSKVTIRGEPGVTINCLDDFCLVFTDVRTVIIQSIHFKNCGCYYHGYYYSYNTYYAVYHYTIEFLQTETEIDNMTFTNSKILFHVVTTLEIRSSAITIKDTVFEKCIYRHGDGSIILIFFDDAVLRFNVRLKSVKVRDNNSSFIIPVYNSLHQILFSVTFMGQNHFTHNKKMVMKLRGFNLFFKGAQLEFSNNLAFHGPKEAPLYMSKCKMSFEHSQVVFKNNVGSLSGGLLAEETDILFLDNTSVRFINNTGELGGALHLDSKSSMSFNTVEFNILVNFTNNVALRGGAIFVDDPWRAGVIPIFKLQSNTNMQVKVIFKNNSALQDMGNHIYGGWLGWLYDKNGIASYNDTFVNQIINFENDNSESESDIASDPIRICLCIDGKVNCSITNYHIEVYGHAANISLVAVGQRFTKNTGYVEAKLLGMRSQNRTIYQQWFRVRPEIENLQKICTNVTYRIYSDNTEEALRLEAYRNYRSFADIVEPPRNSANTSMTKEAMILFEQLSIQLVFKKCPLGFLLDTTYRSCACNLSRAYGLTCDFTKHKIHRTQDQWINTTNNHLNPNEYPGVMVHQHCPYDYCRRDKESMSISFETPNEQCAFNRAGTLCGSCRINFSRVLGSSKCKKCSNYMLLAIIPSGLIAGLVLVIVLMALNLTVSVGTINGLIFYANVIEAQSASFFTENSSYSFFSVFISWLNLNLGIESCFYDGLSPYSETWLQFSFPLYIWILTIAIIVTSHYSSRVSKVSGKNAVQVLATLFLLSYTKIMQLVLTIISSTKIKYPDGYAKTVWLYDSNIEFLSKKHLPLFVSALFFLIFVSIPYTVSLASIQWLYKVSHYRAMFWIQRLKPLLDAYTGPYRSHHRYWTGLLLIARTILLVIFSINQTNNTSVNLLAIIVISFILIAWFSIAKWVYNSILNNILEITFLCNLGITAASVIVDEHKTKIAVYTSTGIAFIIFVCIVMYHTLTQLLHTKCGSTLKRKFSSSRTLPPEQNDPNIKTQSQKKVTFTVVELKQSLLEA